MNIQQLYPYFLKSGSVSTDSRNIKPGCVFFGLKGENFNGNEFVEQAIEAGACCAITDDKERENPDKNIFYFENSLSALQQLANYHKNKMNVPVFSLTGSNGKTTTKELLAAVLAKKYKLTATKGNLNNHIGVPLTLLTIKTDHEIAIVEMGANHQKEIEFLCSIAEPDFGYITNFGKAHLEGFGGEEGVIKGKSELYQYLAANSKMAFVNCDDPKQIELTSEIEEKKLFGNCDDADFKFSFTENEDGSCPRLNYKSSGIQSNLIGSYNAANVAVATAVGLYFRVPFAKIREAIEAYHSDNNRSQLIEKADYKIILDAYNANPSSMEAALRNFNLISAKHKAVVLGDMFELGVQAQEEHQKIAQLAESLDFENIFLIGEHFDKIKSERPTIRTFKDRETAKSWFASNPFHFDYLLIKGSRGMALEKLLDVF